MASVLRRINRIAEINDEKETWKIVVRAIKMWTIPKGARLNIELVLVDKEGDEIMAQMKNIDMEMVNDIFRCGESYVIQNFEVEKNIGQYKCTKHGFLINLVKATKITAHEIPEIPKTMYNFTKFDAILNGLATSDYLIDVMGEIVEIGQWNLDVRPKKVIFSLKDQWETVISCTLWEAFALELKAFLDTHTTGPVVLLLTMAKIKEARGNYPLSIQNSMYGSQMFLNSGVKEIEEFKDHLNELIDPSQKSMIRYSQVGSQHSGSSLYSTVDRFLHNANVSYLDQISKVNKECMCVTVATIQKLLIANGWVYDACPKCNKKVDANDLPVICVGCGNKSASTISRYRVEVRVCQPHESAVFTLWDRECYALIKESADEIKQKIVAEEGVFDPKDIPECLDRVLGKKLAFRFKVVPGNTRHSVSQLSEDDTLITTVLSQLPNLDIEDETQSAILLGNDNKDAVDNEGCISATDECGSHVMDSITPSKRNSKWFDTDLDAIQFEDLSQIQLSCTKKKKHIKTE